MLTFYSTIFLIVEACDFETYQITKLYTEMKSLVSSKLSDQHHISVRNQQEVSIWQFNSQKWEKILNLKIRLFDRESCTNFPEMERVIKYFSKSCTQNVSFMLTYFSVLLFLEISSFSFKISLSFVLILSTIFCNSSDLVEVEDDEKAISAVSFNLLISVLFRADIFSPKSKGLTPCLSVE